MAAKSNGQIKAIETVYKGYRFRSRLEARWAVFFDALGVKWEYEKEGFDLGEAGWYLPDFWLPGLNLWFEIKPFDSEPNPEWLDLITKFRDCGVGAICLFGNPDGLGALRCWDLTDSSGGNYDCDIVAWALDGSGKPTLIAVDDYRDRSFWGDWMMSKKIKGLTNMADLIMGTPDSQWSTNVRDLNRARLAFKQARFEHGENGAPQNGKI